MRFAKRIEKRKVRPVKFQIERLDKVFHSLSDVKKNINLNFENSMIGQEIILLRKTIEDQYSTNENFSVTDIISKMKAILDQNTRIEAVERKLSERNMLILESKELDKALKTVKREQEECSIQLSQLEKERRVFTHLIASNLREKNKNNIIEQ
ncbi:PREDICTED: uncharacterized protein LOC107172251 [Diuraphis noxia]|uniref:uncharacterized protein LOC107172251 n=1 Tax=Diuraphis noxia TaxID=143948 RepID=UPI00076383AF|nr:PREDICTED: uncharacterized protein LOC107172251 [Diuraphis noxia]